jgi:SAM-dependent methyltransferase
MWLIDNKSVFTTIEFDSWRQRRRLIPAEKFLIQKYCAKTGKTLEAGTGAGRILYEMQALGFTSLYGFDLVYRLLECAKKRDLNNTIGFDLQDATHLGYKDSTFDQIIYLQQVLCFIENDRSRLIALKEAYRILRPGGIALFSFLSFEARRRSAAYIPYLLYLTLLRRLNGSKRAIQHLPWLRLDGKFNWDSLLDSRPYVYWYRLEEIGQLLQEVGFQIVAIGSTRQINQRVMHKSYQTLANEPIDGILYVVGKK